MSILQHIKKAELKRRALIASRVNSLKAYRGVPYERITNGKAITGRMTYRGIQYTK